MEEHKFFFSDYFEYTEEHYETYPEDESVYTLEIKKLNSMQFTTRQTSRTMPLVEPHKNPVRLLTS